MTLKEYQDQAMTTCLPESRNFSYMFLNLVGEVGEFSSKVAKAIRKEKVFTEINGINYEMETSEKMEFLEELKKEAGDIL